MTLAAMDDPASAEEVRKRLLRLLESQWPDIRTRVWVWLGRPSKQDEHLIDEVFLRILVRIKSGRSIVRFLVKNPDYDPLRVLFAQAHWVSREVRKSFGQMPEVPDDDPSEFANVPVDAVDEHGGSRILAEMAADSSAQFESGPAPTPGSVEARLADINLLLDRGEEAWERLCHDHVLDCAEWTPHQKWTAIGLMWGFTSGHIAAIRYLRVDPDPALLIDRHRTESMISKVRKKGRNRLRGMTAEFRLEHDLPADDSSEPDGDGENGGDGGDQTDDRQQ